jgi:hypothetical protein
MSYLTPIYDAWAGNAEALAADIGVPGVTVRQWRNRGNIPPRYWSAIIGAAAKRGVMIDLSQFLPPTSQAA